MYIYISFSMSLKETHKSTNKYIFTGVDFTSRYKVGWALKTKKDSDVAFVFEAIYKNGGVFKYKVKR